VRNTSPLHEAKLLQGLPADFTLAGPLTARWRMVGNCVPPALAEAVARALLRSLGGMALSS